jgi:hypothetical protein
MKKVNGYMGSLSEANMKKCSMSASLRFERGRKNGQEYFLT